MNEKISGALRDPIGFVKDFLSGASHELVRYLLVTIVNVFNHQLVLWIARNQWGWPSAWANIFAATLAAIPAYILSRYWVWEVKGRNSFKTQILPFWLVTFFGMGISTAAVVIGELISDNKIWIQLASLGGYFVAWVIKFVLLNKVFTQPTEPIEK